MNKAFKIMTAAVLALLVGLGLPACEKKAPKALALEVSALTMDCAGTAQTVNLTSNVAWTLSGTLSWLTVTPKSGTGDAVLTLQTQPHVGETARSAELKFTATDDPALVATLSVSQTNATLRVEGTVPAADGQGQQLRVTAQGEGTFSIKSNAKWNIGSFNGNLHFEPEEGQGDAQVRVSLPPNPTKRNEKGQFFIYYFGQNHTVDYMQDPGPNNPPEVPSVTWPLMLNEGVSVNPTFTWTCSDPDEDALRYTLYLSRDQVNWDSYGPFDAPFAYLDTALEPHTLYYFKIEADDMDGGVTETPVKAFLTSDALAHSDGEARVILRSTKANPSFLVFTGDGYLAQDCVPGGVFERDVDEAVDAFFSTEPYKSFKSYFTVIRVPAFSQERGISERDKFITKNTAFSTQYEGGTSMTCNYDKVLEYAKRSPLITNKELRETALVILLANHDRYGGTCWMSASGQSIAMCPVGKIGNMHLGAQANSIIMHEAGGHGYGRLADEYINHDKQIPENEIKTLETWHKYNFFHNVDLTSDLRKIRWAALVGLEGYDRVGAYEGGNYYSKGVWRAEQHNCMIDNRLYFSAYSRYLIMKRILETAGEPFSLEIFLALDKDKDSAFGLPTKAPGPDFVPLAPPILVID